MALAEAGALPLVPPLAVQVAESLFELCGRVSNKSSTNETNAAIVPYLVWRDHPMSANTKQGNETTGRDSFHGCGMDAYLLSEGIDVNKPHFTFEEVVRQSTRQPITGP